jgi:hypothetical protein
VAAGAALTIPLFKSGHDDPSTAGLHFRRLGPLAVRGFDVVQGARTGAAKILPCA